MKKPPVSDGVLADVVQMVYVEEDGSTTAMDVPATVQQREGGLLQGLQACTMQEALLTKL